MALPVELALPEPDPPAAGPVRWVSGIRPGEPWAAPEADSAGVGTAEFGAAEFGVTGFGAAGFDSAGVGTAEFGTAGFGTAWDPDSALL